MLDADIYGMERNALQQNTYDLQPAERAALLKDFFLTFFLLTFRFFFLLLLISILSAGI